MKKTITVGKKKVKFEAYISIYNKSYFDFNVLPQFEIGKDRSYCEIFFRFLVFCFEILIYPGYNEDIQ